MPKTHYQERQDTKAFTGGGAGETNTASNVGTDGIGVFHQKAGVQLQFKHIAPASSKVTVVATGQDIDLDVAEANLDHDNIANNADVSHLHIGTSAPSEVGGLWLDTTDGAAAYRLKVYNGSVWVQIAKV